MLCNIINLKTVSNPNPGVGSLTFVESNRDVPFAFNRMYWIYNADEAQHRGFHSHKRNWQLLVCQHGSIDILLDDGVEKGRVTLDDPSKGLILHPGIWREMIWNTDDAVLFVAASEYYDPSEYIRDYDEFLADARKKREAETNGRKKFGK